MKQNTFLRCSWRFLRSNTLAIRRIIIIIGKNNWDLEIYWITWKISLVKWKNNQAGFCYNLNCWAIYYTKYLLRVRITTHSDHLSMIYDETFSFFPFLFQLKKSLILWKCLMAMSGEFKSLVIIHALVYKLRSRRTMKISPQLIIDIYVNAQFYIQLLYRPYFGT